MRQSAIRRGAAHPEAKHRVARGRGTNASDPLDDLVVARRQHDAHRMLRWLCEEPIAKVVMPL